MDLYLSLLAADFFAHGGNNELRGVMPLCRQALHIKGRPVVALDEVHNFAGQGPAGNQKHITLSGGELKFVRWLKINSGHQFSTYQIGVHAKARLRRQTAGFA